MTDRAKGSTGRQRAERAALVLGFGLTLLGMLGSQFYLGAAQHERAALADAMATARNRAKILRTAQAWDEVFIGTGGTVLVLPRTGAGLVPALQRRAMVRRHDGVRQAIQQVALAGVVPLRETLAAYDELAAAEQRLGTAAALGEAGQFERDLSTLAVQASGRAPIEAILSHADWARADAEVGRRGDLLAGIAGLGALLILVATLMAETDSERAAPPSSGDHALALRAMGRALEEARRRIAVEQAVPGARA